MYQTNRLEAFSDGVLAIAITLLVLDLKVPPLDELRSHHEPLARALGAEWPTFAAYVTSFLIIGIIWINHHAVISMIGRIDRAVLFLNLLLLMFVVTVPFTTALLSEYLTAGGGDARTAAVCYSLSMLGMAVTFTLLYGWAVRHPVLLGDGVDPQAVRASFPRFGIGVLVYLATVAVALVSAVACLVVHFAVALYYAFEQTGSASLPLRRRNVG